MSWRPTLIRGRTLLAEIYGWFTDGFETRHLRAAKVLLDELSQGR
jgi:hypothetical protein